MHRLLRLACDTAVCGDTKRNYRLGAVGVRKDGCVVVSRNGATLEPVGRAHAEARLARKLDQGATVYVARVRRDGEIGMAKPCAKCESVLRNKGVKKVYYTIGPKEWGCLEF